MLLGSVTIEDACNIVEAVSAFTYAMVSIGALLMGAALTFALLLWIVPWIARLMSLSGAVFTLGNYEVRRRGNGSDS